jgi:hypothetical protein
MALFGRASVAPSLDPSRFRGTLSISPPWKHPASYAQEDLVARKPFASPGGMVDRTEQQWWVVDVDGTRATARQRALPQTELLPAPHRRARSGLRTGYQGRKRGEVVRTRMVVLQAHTHQFLGTFGAAGNGDYRGELRRAVEVITGYATQRPSLMCSRLALG